MRKLALILFSTFLILATSLAAEPIDLDDPTGGVKGLRKL